jgi:hypothetical protein
MAAQAHVSCHGPQRCSRRAAPGRRTLPLLSLMSLFCGMVPLLSLTCSVALFCTPPAADQPASGAALWGGASARRMRLGSSQEGAEKRLGDGVLDRAMFCYPFHPRE